MLDENLQEEKINWKINLCVLWVGVFLACASYTSCVPFLPVYILRELKVPMESVNFWSGICFAATFFAAGIMAPYWGALADHVGQRRMAIRAGIGIAVTYFLIGVCQDVYQLLFVRLLCGVVCGFVPAGLSIVSSTLPSQKIGWGMGLMQTAIASGGVTGPLMGGYLSAWFGMRASFFVGSMALCFATTGIYFLVREKKYESLKEAKNLHLMQDLKDSLGNSDLVYTMFMFFSIQSCILLCQPIVTVYVGELLGSMGDETVKMSGIIFSLSGIAGIISAPFWGKFGQRNGFVKTFALVSFVAGVINLTQPIANNVWQFAGIQLAQGLFLAGAVPNINANLTRITTLETRGKAFGLVTSAQQFGGVAGPILGGFLATYMRPPFVLVVLGCILICVSTYTYFVKVRNTN